MCRMPPAAARRRNASLDGLRLVTSVEALTLLARLLALLLALTAGGTLNGAALRLPPSAAAPVDSTACRCGS